MNAILPLDKAIYSMIEYSTSQYNARLYMVTYDTGWWAMIDTGLSNPLDYMEQLLNHLGDEMVTLKLLKGKLDG